MSFFDEKVPKQFCFLLAAMAGVCWGTHGTFSFMLGEYGVSDHTVALISPLGVFIFFFLLILKSDIRELAVPKRLIPLLILYGLMSAVFNLATIKAYFHLPVGIVHTVIFCNLFLLMIFSRILFKTPFTASKLLFCVLAVAGISLMLDVFGGGAVSRVGFLWTMAAMVSWAVLVTCDKLLLGKGMSGNAVLFFQGLLGFLILSFIAPPPTAISEIVTAVKLSGGAALIPFAGIIFITSIGSLFLYIQALKKMEPALVQLGYVMDPLTATVLGLLLFGQTLKPLQVFGVALIIGLVIAVEVSEIRAAGKETA